MNGGTGGSTLREMLSWVPVVYGRINVIIVSANDINFAIFILAKTLYKFK